MTPKAAESTKTSHKDFIREMIEHDLETGRCSQIVTRFPPEPNGYLHIGHAKSICLNFGLALEYGGVCNLRFDDTNPLKEDQEYVDSIIRDIRWLGFGGDRPVLFASDYFERMYEVALQLIRDGKAYVCSLSDEEIRTYRGSLREAGKDSPYRIRTIEENLTLFEEMRCGKHSDGAHVLRAKIDMSASNMKLRDPLLYRIRHATHHRTGDTWPIYPMYDFAHPLEDAFEGITHSLCTLEFENNRAIYDWVIENAKLPTVGTSPPPQQTEFARLFLGYTVMSKRKLLRLVEDRHVDGWDDPRMPTIAGMRRRGYRPEAIREFCSTIGVSKNNSVVDLGKLEHAVRDDLNQHAPRVMAVLNPVKVIIENYPEGESETLNAPSFPEDIGKPGCRDISFSRELFIERTDVELHPTPDFRRLAKNRWIRLRHAYCLRCDDIKTDPKTGDIIEVHCYYDPSTLAGGMPADGNKVWGVIHWVDAKTAVPAEVRLYDRLFTTDRPDNVEDVVGYLNPTSLTINSAVLVEQSAATITGQVQFERHGYFCPDSVHSKASNLVFNRIIGLRDTYAKQTTTPKPSVEAPKSARAKTRPKSRSKADVRDATRRVDSTLQDRLTQYEGYGVDAKDADFLSGSRAWGDLLEALHGAGLSWGVAAKWLVNVHPRHEDEPAPVASKLEELAATVAASEGRISTANARRLWLELVNQDTSAEALIAKLGMEQLSDDSALLSLIEEVIQANPDKVTAYQNGKETLLGFFVGQVMRASKGTANPERVKALVAQKLQ